MRREVPLLITFITGVVFALSYFIPGGWLGQTERVFGDWITIVQAFAVWLGVLNLLKISLIKIQRKEHDWGYSVVIAVCLVGTIAAGMYSGFAPQFESFRDPETPFNFIFRNIFAPLGATMFAILAFYVASASYRAFRARNREATILLIASFFVMGGRVPLLDSIFMPIIDGTFFADFAGWIMSYPVTAGQRAIAIGIALGIMASSLRVILGIERSHIGGGN